MHVRYQGSSSSQICSALLIFVPAVVLALVAAVLPTRSTAQEPPKHMPKESVTLKGPFDRPSRLALSPNGKRLFSGSFRRIIGWNVEEARPTLLLNGHTGELTSLAVSQDGKRLFSASVDKTIKVWDLEAQKEILTLRGHTQGILSMVISNDEKRLFSASREGIRVWDLESRKETGLLRRHSVNTLAISQNGKRLASGGLGGLNCFVKVWDIDKATELLNLSGHKDRVTCLAFSLDGKQLYSGSDDMTGKVWDLETGKEVSTLQVHNFPVAIFALNKDDTRLFSCGDQSLTAWNLQTGKPAFTLDHESGFDAVTLSRDGRRLFCGMGDVTIKVWQIK